MTGSSVTMADLMDASGVKFGTSGARGLVRDMTDRVCYAYTAAFLQSLAGRDGGATATEVGVAGDLRASTPRIMKAVIRACADHGARPLDCGRIPSPAAAHFGLQRKIPTIMVTGSHIPDDRNGIKFNGAWGEILKADEARIRQQTMTVPDIFDGEGMLRAGIEAPALATDEARRLYLDRFLGNFSPATLRGQRVVVYRHSAVGRDLVCEILAALGAEVVSVGSSESFIPVDTEAIRREDVDLIRGWAQTHRPFAVVSTDGDSDRPLVADEHGQILRGDIAALLCARYVGASVVVTPVSSNTAVEKCGFFRRVVRTRIGSPYVIEAMMRAAETPAAGTIVGYEANGGFLSASAIALRHGTLSPLATRDAMIVILAVLGLAAESGQAISSLVGDLPPRHTSSDRIKDFPAARAAAIVAELSDRDPEQLAAAFDGGLGPVAGTDTTDGLRITFASGEIAHLRPSGNAPELRCYAEAESPARAQAITAFVLGRVATWPDSDPNPRR